MTQPMHMHILCSELCSELKAQTIYYLIARVSYLQYHEATFPTMTPNHAHPIPPFPLLSTAILYSKLQANQSNPNT